MKRGLVMLDTNEIPPGALERRVAALQEVLRDEGIAVALVYGDVYHSGDITYLSNICIYWNEAILAIPVTGEPALLMKLSRRVHPWMRATSSLDDLRSGPDLARLVADFLAQCPVGDAGIVEQSWWPAPLLEGIATAGGRKLRDLGAVVRTARQAPSVPELALLRDGASLTARAVSATFDAGLTSHERAGLAEFAARRGGVEDVNVYCHPATKYADTVEVVGEYRGYWTAAARILLRGSPGWAPGLTAAWDEAARTLRAGVTIADVRSALKPHLAPLALTWTADLVQHTDLETAGGYRLRRESQAPVRTGAVAAVRIELDLPDGAQAVVADTYQVGADGAERLTADLPGALVEL